MHRPSGAPLTAPAPRRHSVLAQVRPFGFISSLAPAAAQNRDLPQKRTIFGTRPAQSTGFSLTCEPDYAYITPSFNH